MRARGWLSFVVLVVGTLGKDCRVCGWAIDVPGPMLVGWALFVFPFLAYVYGVVCFETQQGDWAS